MFYFIIISNVVSSELIASFTLIVYVPGIASFGTDQNVSQMNSFVVLHDNVLSVTFPDGSIIIDPWRSYTTKRKIKVIHYGDTTK